MYGSAEHVEQRGEHYRFQMFSREANDAVAAMVAAQIQQARTERLTRAETIAALQDRIRLLARAHGEVYDTEPQWAIVDEMNLFCDEVGWVRIDRDDL